MENINIKPGHRVQLHPATNAWMQGDRYGTIVQVGTKLVTVKLDTSGRTLRFHPAGLRSGDYGKHFKADY